MRVKLNAIWNLSTLAAEAQQRGEPHPLEVLAAVKMPAAKSYYLGKQIASIKSEIAALDAERVKLIQRLGIEQKDADGNVTGHQILPNTEAWEAFSKEVNELCEGEAELPGVALALADLGNTEISAEVFRAIDFLIEDEPIATPEKVTNIKQGRKKKAA